MTLCTNSVSMQLGLARTPNPNSAWKLNWGVTSSGALSPDSHMCNPKIFSLKGLMTVMMMMIHNILFTQCSS